MLKNYKTLFAPIVFVFASSSMATTSAPPAAQEYEGPVIEEGYVADRSNVVDPQEQDEEIFEEHEEKEPVVYDDPDEFEYSGYRGGGGEHGGGGHGR